MLHAQQLLSLLIQMLLGEEIAGSTMLACTRYALAALQLVCPAAQQPRHPYEQEQQLLYSLC